VGRPNEIGRGVLSVHDGDDEESSVELHVAEAATMDLLLFDGGNMLEARLLDDAGLSLYAPDIIWEVAPVTNTRVVTFGNLALIGSIAWFAVGRDWGGRTEAVPFGDPRRTEAAADRMSGMSAADRATLEAERRLAEKEARVRRLEAEVRAKRDQRGGDAAG
jgi:hypothetical protein